MNQTIESILSRRSVRKYLPQQIKKEDLELIMKTAIYAPSSNNEQNWHFTVIQDKSLLDYINTKTKELMSKSPSEWASKMGKSKEFNVFYNAPTVVLVCGEDDSTSAPINCSAATENMMIAAQSLGIGSCWIGVVGYFFTNDEYIKKLNIPEGFKPFYMITLGYQDPQFKAEAPERKANTVSYI